MSFKTEPKARVRILLLIAAFAAICVTVLHFANFDNNRKIQYADLRSTYSKFDATSQLKALCTRNPQDDASVAFKSHDRRFVGAFGITIITPGTESLKKIDPQFLITNDVKIINGTTDYSHSATTDQINIAADEYAKKYNYCLIALIFKSNTWTNGADLPARPPQ